MTANAIGFDRVDHQVIRRVCKEVAQELDADCVASAVYELENGVYVVVCEPLPFLKDIQMAYEVAYDVMKTIAEALAVQHNASVLYVVKNTKVGYKTGVYVNVKRLGDWGPAAKYFEPPTLAIGDPNRFN
jgi:kynureninase